MTSSRANCAPRWDGQAAGRRVTVMGLGRFGGGIGAVRWLGRQGAAVTVTDLRPAAQLAASLQAIADAPLAGTRFGTHCEQDFTAADLVVASPAIRPDHPCLQAAREAGVPVTTEIAVLCRLCPGRIIGVTGSVGKSTTAALIHHLLKAAGARAWLGGNLGGSLLDTVDEVRSADWVVLELSSFQLQYLADDQWSPEISVITNFAPNHLDWHASLEEYRQAKQSLLRWQSPSDAAVLNGDDPDVRTWQARGRRLLVEAAPLNSCGYQIRDGSGDIVETLDWPEPAPLPGRHNRCNAALAVTAVRAAGVPVAAPADALATYIPLPHRLEYLGEFRGRRFYNDSKATTPQSAIAALQAFDQPVILLAGGSDKGVDLQSFADEIRRHTRSVAMLGATGPVLERLLSASTSADDLPRRMVAADFPAAFRWAVAQSAPGDVILLSPGCASFGWFRDYEDRGEQFRAAVREWAEQ